MSHPIIYGEKSLDLTSPAIQLTTEPDNYVNVSALGIKLNGVALPTADTNGVTSFGPVGSTPNANGASVLVNVATLQPASATLPGVMTALAQIFGGLKTFTNGVRIGTGSGVFNINNVNLVWLGAFDDENSIYMGQSSGATITTGNKYNCGVGALTLRQCTTGIENSCFGSGTGISITTGSKHTLLGRNVCANLLTGQKVIAIGTTSGSTYTSNESFNILLDHQGIVGESGAIHIGTVGNQTTCSIVGIYGNSPASPQAVIIDSNGNLGSQALQIQGVTTVGTIGSGVANGLAISGVTLTPHLATSTTPGMMGTGSQTFAGLKTFNGSIIIPALASIGCASGVPIFWLGSSGSQTNIFVGRNGGLATFSATNCVGLGDGALRFITTGSNCTALGFSAGSAYTGAESNNICINHVGVLGESNMIRIGTSGTQTACAIAGIYGVTPASAQAVIIDSGGNMGSTPLLTLGAIGSSPNANGMTLSAGRVLNQEPASASFGGVVTTASQTFAGNKIFNNGLQLGSGQQILNGSGSTLIWTGPFSDNNSIYAGILTGANVTTGTKNNAAYARQALSAATTANNCSAVGYQSLLSLLTGSNCSAFGAGAGSAYTGSESNNICIGNVGVVSESAVMRVGTVATHTSCYIAGISGVTSAGATAAVINASGLLGTIVSSRTKKNTILDVTPDKLEALMKLRVVSFFMNDDPKKQFPCYGCIAEEVEPILPETIRYAPQTEMRLNEKDELKECCMVDEKQEAILGNVPQTIDYAMLWPLLLAQVQSLTKQVQDLSAIVNKLI